jgi:diguanylate cyclase (GGDEF)-like protein
MTTSLLHQRTLLFSAIAAAAVVFQGGPSALGLSALMEEWWAVAWWIVAPALAAVTCLLAAVFSEGEDRKAWRDFGFGCGLWSAGTLVWQLYDVRDGIAKFPGMADAAYLLTCVLFITGMFHYCRERRTTAIQVSNFALSLCAVAISGFLLLFPYILASELKPLGTLVASLYPVAWFGTAVFGLTCLAIYAPTHKRFTVGLLLMGALAQAVADLFYGLELMGSSYQVGAFFDSFWVISFLLICWAAGEQIRAARKQTHRSTSQESKAQQRAEAFVAAVALALIFVSVGIWGFLVSGPVFLIFIPVALLFAGFLGLRQHWGLMVERRAQEHLMYLASHDGLTGLGNRLAFHQRLKSVLGSWSREFDVAVLCLDLDEFKLVNDTLGHPAGDALLVHIAARLRSCVRDGDLVCRMGGDEFAIIQSLSTSRREVENLANRILNTLRAPYQLEEGAVTIGLSIGIALAPRDATDPNELLKLADIALYNAKTGGRGTFRFSEPEMEEHLKARQALKADLSAAVANGELELVYQPIMDLSTDRVGALEALLRWRHPERGLVAPTDFIPFAEENGLIVPIGEWVLKQACLEAAKWPDHLTVAVNVSASEFRGNDLPARVSAALVNAGLPSRRLELEITETALLQDSDANVASLHRLRELGVKIALDDFGTGYSSLGYLRRFPFSRIKIDRSFVGNVEEEAESQQIIRAIISLGQALGMEITAEGVETRQQLDRIRAKGCNDAQGYFFSHAVAAEAVPSLIVMLNAASFGALSVLSSTTALPRPTVRLVTKNSLSASSPRPL